jgi:hypothetical protein
LFHRRVQTPKTTRHLKEVVATADETRSVQDHNDPLAMNHAAMNHAAMNHAAEAADGL